MMRVIADFHVHSPYSRATSQKIRINDLYRNGKLKGLNLIGTGDVIHKAWREELEKSLDFSKDYGLYLSKKSLREVNDQNIFFIPTTEVNCIFSKEELKDSSKKRKSNRKQIHHLIIMPDLKTAEEVSKVLSKFGKMDADGRPDLHISPAKLVEILMSISSNIVIVPAHIWTPWYSLFGAFSGFNSIAECYEDQLKHIYALETGLSSDPPMNWRLSQLDDFLLVSNSDAHSANPWRLGREANIFELEELSCETLIKALKKRSSEGKNKLSATIEVYPDLGKYHYTGHRKCGVSLSPDEALKIDNKCPVCGRSLTIGVMQRVEQLADRSQKFTHKNKPGFISTLPLHEILSTVHGITTYHSKTLWKAYYEIVEATGSEFNALIFTPEEVLEKTVPREVFKMITALRKNKIRLKPGFDGEYGKIITEEKMGEIYSPSLEQQKKQKQQQEIKKSTKPAPKESKKHQKLTILDEFL